jgi:hypothetical protein
MANVAKPQTSDDWKWKVEDAARTLIRAEEIKADAKLFAAAKVELAKQQKATSRAIESLKRVAKRL